MMVQIIRKPKFKRASDAPPMSLTPRDLEILDLLRRFRFMRSTHIAPMVALKFPDSSEEKVKRRLRQLFDEGYIDRPNAQKRYYVEEGAQPMIYALGLEGANALRDHRGLIIARGLTTKNKDIKQPALMHTCAVADILCCIELAARERFISSEELLKSTGEGALSWQAKVKVKSVEETISVRPDGYFGLRFDDGTSALFFLEADRGTMPVTRTGPRQTSLLQKIEGYRHSREQYEKLFGRKGIRTLFVVPTKERVSTLLNAVLALTEGKGARQFMYTTYDELLTGDTLNTPILTGKGERKSLSDI